LALFAVSLPLSAALISVNTDGTFSSLTPNTAWTGADDTWSLTFDIDMNPVVSQVTVGSPTTGGGFDPVISNFVYELNGSPVNVSAVEVFYYNTDFAGLFSVCFCGCNLDVSTYSPVNGFTFFGPQAYSGSESAPTILTGPFTETNSTLGEPGNEVYVASTGYVQTLGTVDLENTEPEPSTVALSTSGLLLLAVLAVRRKRSVASALPGRR
jgi:hypothetical protein